MKTLSQLSEQIIETWAKPKGLCDRTQSQALAQHSKTVEEVNELLEAISEWDDLIDDPAFLGHAAWVGEVMSKIRLEAGDALVTLAIQCAIRSFTLEECIEEYLYYGIGAKAKDLPLSKTLEYLTNQVSISIADTDYAQSTMFTIGRMVKSIELNIKPYDLSLPECLEAAWEKIRDRTGKTINGVFVKSEDLL